MRLASVVLAVMALWASCASAQFFNFFQQGGHGGPGGQPREQEPPPGGDASWFEARTDASTCSTYLCPRTLACVSEPSRCPCPFPQQTRCNYPDGQTGKLDQGGSFCVSEGSCEKVLLHRGLWWQGKKLDPAIMKAFI